MKNEKVLTLVEGAVMVALATVLSFVKIVHLPWGGSITLLSMLPIIVFSIKRGVANGLACLLRLGIYQILFMDKVPDRAAVHETVELTKRRGKARAAGMINAVLRKCASSKNTLPPLPQDSFISKAAVQYSHPRWLVERLTALATAGSAM